MLAQIVEFPRFLGTHPRSNLFLINENFDCPQIATEVTRPECRARTSVLFLLQVPKLSPTSVLIDL
jgi:hypothetical protein